MSMQLGSTLAPSAHSTPAQPAASSVLHVVKPIESTCLHEVLVGEQLNECFHRASANHGCLLARRRFRQTVQLRLGNAQAGWAMHQLVLRQAVWKPAMWAVLCEAPFRALSVPVGGR